MVGLRARVEAQHGEAFLPLTGSELECARRPATQAHRRTAPSLPPVSKDEHPASGYHFSNRYIDLCLQLLAFRALSDALPLREEARRAPAHGDFLLTTAEQRRLRNFAGNLESGLAELVFSKCSDWGFALLLGMARLQAIDESLRSGRLVLLDAFPAESLVIPAANAQRGDPFRIELRDWTRRDFSASRSHFF